MDEHTNGDAGPMVVVAGHIMVDPARREEYLATCVYVVEQARRADGCLDFALSADLVDAGRVNVYERWESQAAVEAFRGSGANSDEADDQTAMMESAAVSEYDVAGVRVLSG